MMKKLVVSLLAALILLFGVNLAGPLTAEAVVITPFWTNTLSMEPSILFNDNMYLGTVSGFKGTTKVEVNMVLYENHWYGYEEVSSHSGSSNSSLCTIYKAYTYSSGIPYKLVLSANVTRNGTTEYVSVNIQKTK